MSESSGNQAMPVVAHEAPRALRIAAGLSRCLPPLPHMSCVGNRILKPLFARRSSRSYILPVWPGQRMLLDPSDCIGGNLTFAPQLYDRWERQAMRALLPARGTFVDVGANVGAYALWAARCVGTGGRVLAIEADPLNFAALEQNIGLNNLANVVDACQAGASDREEVRILSRNVTGNCGGHSFVGTGRDGVAVTCRPLRDILAEHVIPSVDMMKVDIEGFELTVLRRFFGDVGVGSPLRPRYLLVETTGGPGGVESASELLDFLQAEGYAMLRSDSNALLERVR